MAYQAAVRSHAPEGKRLFSGFTRLFSLRRTHPGLALDPRELSDHLKRDLGFLDGKATPGSIK